MNSWMEAWASAMSRYSLRNTSSYFSVFMNDSQAALSQGLPLRLMLIWMPCSFSRSEVFRRCSLLHRPSRRPRTSSQCLQHPLFFDALQAPLQKIDLHRLPADLALQLCDLAFAPAPLTVAGKGVARRLPELTPPAIQQVGVHLQATRYFGQRNTCLQPPNGRQLELPRERPA